MTSTIGTPPRPAGDVAVAGPVEGTSHRRARRRLPKFGLALPASLWWVVFFVVPVVLVIAASFGSKVPNSAGRVSYSDISLDNYREALDGGLDGTFFKVLLQGMRTTLLGTALCLLTAFPLAYLLAIKIRRGKGLLLAMLAIPFFTNFLIRTLAWRIVLAPKGLISNTLIDWGLIDQRLNLLDSRTGVQIGVVYNYLPLMIFPLFVALDRLDPALLEGSKDLFADRLATFRQVTLPLARPGIIAGIVLVFVPLAGDYITANLLGGAKGNMPGNLVASQFTQAQNPPLGAAVAVILVIGILGFLALGFLAGWAVGRLNRVDRRAGTLTAALLVLVAGTFALGGSWRATLTVLVAGAVVVGAVVLYSRLPEAVGRTALWIWSALVIVFLFLPLAFVVGHSFNDNRSMFVWSHFSTKWYGSMWDNEQMTGAVRSSFSAAAVAALVSVVLGTLAGITLARRPGRWTIWFLALVLLVLTTPEIVDATGMQLEFVQLGGPLREGLIPLWVGQSIFSIAVVTLIVRARMAGMDESLEHAAADLFATPFTAFRQITLPLIAPAILAGGLLAFTFALDNVIISDFVKAPGTNTFPTYVFGLAKTVMKPEVASMATVLIGVTLFSLVVAALILRRTGDDSSKIAATLTGGG
ncbi:MAG TPA: ABC transporter permease subunit [Ilumatobacter sp.]|jgi:spermidine/putrescine transport system permease protein|nr:ABC transporter permease subunit [Ilumatobacter sp.]